MGDRAEDGGQGKEWGTGQMTEQGTGWGTGKSVETGQRTEDRAEDG